MLLPRAWDEEKDGKDELWRMCPNNSGTLRSGSLVMNGSSTEHK